MIITSLKRTIASYLAVFLDIIRSIPGTEPFWAPLEALAALFGITGVAHTAVKKELSYNVLKTAAALLSMIIFLGQFFPAQIGPFMPILQKLAAMLGAMGIAASNRKVIEVNNAPPVSDDVKRADPEYRGKSTL